jgi:hypothetical protein
MIKEASMSEEFTYPKERLDKQQKWHSDESTANKNRYYLTEIIALVAGAVIPIVNLLDVVPDPWTRILSTALATIIVIITGMSKLYKFQENWLSYRSVSEALKREKEHYLHEVGDYAVRSDKERRKILVGHTEDILASLTSRYIARHRAEEESQQPTAPTT